MKRQPTGWEKIFTSIHMTENWYLECIKNYKMFLNNKEQNSPTSKWASK